MTRDEILRSTCRAISERHGDDPSLRYALSMECATMTANQLVEL